MTARRQKRVLCIDADTVSLQIRMALLRTGGFSTVPATTVESAQQFTREHPVDAVVVDENAYASAGIETVARAFPSSPILLLSSAGPWSKRSNGDGRVHTFAKCDGPEAFLSAVQECIWPDSKAGLSNAS